MRRDCASWGIFSVPICFRKELSSRIDPGIRMKELGGLYINFDGSKSKPVSSSLQKLKEKKIQDEVNKWLIFPFLKVISDAEWIMNTVVMQGWVNPIAPEMVLFMVSLQFFLTLAFYLWVSGVFWLSLVLCSVADFCCCLQVMKKSVIGPDFEKKDAVPPYSESKQALKLKHRVSFRTWSTLRFDLCSQKTLRRLLNV